MSEFYVYTYTNEKTGIIFYVGKGKGNRASYHLRKCLRSKRQNAFYKELRMMLAEGNLPSIYIIPCTSESNAFVMEVELIARYGRKDQGLGNLLNATDGGDGVSGLKFSEETKQKIAEIRRNAAPRVFSEEAKVNMRNAILRRWKEWKQTDRGKEVGKKTAATRRANGSYNFTEEHRKKIGLSAKGRPAPNKGKITPTEVRKKQSEAAKARYARGFKAWNAGTRKEPVKTYLTDEEKSAIKRAAALKMWEARRAAGTHKDIGKKTANTRKENGSYGWTQEQIENIKEKLKGNKNRLGGKKHLKNLPE